MPQDGERGQCGRGGRKGDATPLQIVKKNTRTEKSSSRRRVARPDVRWGEAKVKEIAATTLKTFLNSNTRKGARQTERRGVWGTAESKSVAKAQGNAMAVAVAVAVASVSRGICGRIGQVDYAMRCGA